MLSTNFEPLLKIAQECMEPNPKGHDGQVHVRLRLWVDPRGHSRPPWPKPYFRGHGHLIFAGFDTWNSLLFDLRQGRVLGRLTPEFAADATWWKVVVIPVLLAIMGAAMGRAVLHCACLAWRGAGILLAGDSGAGKSTLSFALAQSGFNFVSDDRTLFWYQESRLLAHGLGPFMKLRREAARHFGRAEDFRSIEGPNEEGQIFLDPAAQSGVERIRACEPRFLFFLEQAGDSTFSISPMTSWEAATRLAGDLHQETAETSCCRRKVIESLVERECYLLRFADEPSLVARRLQAFLADRLEGGQKVPECVSKPTASSIRPRMTRQDPLRRFTPLALSAEFHPMRRKIRIESNSALVMEYARRALGRFTLSTGALPDFCWKVVSDAEGGLEPPWPEMTAFSDGHLRFVNLGHRSFIAIDKESREAVAFVSDGLTKDEVGFASIVLSSLFYLSAGTLGLAALSAACIAEGSKGLLLFGVPRSGKTTSCFMARGQGYRFHADQACFLEMRSGSLEAWGEFWPAAFHPEAPGFIPQIADLGRPFEHREAKYLCIEKDPSQQDAAGSVAPVGCILLERNVPGSPKLIPLSAREFERMLEDWIPFKDDSIAPEARRAVDKALTKLPAYRLLCGDAPSAPSHFLRTLLNTHELVECLR